MNSKEVFEKIKEKYFDTKQNVEFTNNHMIEVTNDFFEDMGILIQIIDAISKYQNIKEKDDIISRIEKLEKDVLFLNENHTDNKIKLEKCLQKINNAEDLCINKMKEYREYKKMFGDCEFTNQLLIERDFAQKIYNILF